MACRLAGAKPLSEPMLKYSTLGSKLQWNINRNLHIFIQENTFESVVCEMVSILSRPQRVNINPASILELEMVWRRTGKQSIPEPVITLNWCIHAYIGLIVFSKLYDIFMHAGQGSLSCAFSQLNCPRWYCRTFRWVFSTLHIAVQVLLIRVIQQYKGTNNVSLVLADLYDNFIFTTKVDKSTAVRQ